MNMDILLDGVLHSVLGGRRKRSRRARRYLRRGTSSILSHPTAVLTAAGVAWGIFETLQNSGAFGGKTPPSPAESNPSPMPFASASSPPPPPPPTAAANPPPSTEPIPADTMRLVRLAISAGNADGAMNEHERAVVIQQATAAGVGDIVEREMQSLKPLAEIVAGVTDPVERATLYVLAFTIARADEQLTGAERIYLAQLAHLLDLAPATVQQLETDTGSRIDALGDQDQLGG